jgi:3-mercaptopyruvate sulfurtransferase SseA
MLSVVARAVLLLLIGGGLGLAANAVRPDGVSLRGHRAPVACEAPRSGPLAVEVQTPERAVRLCGDPGVLIADARPAARFAEGHVAGAVHLPCAAPRDEASTVVSRLADRTTVIVYGDTTEEARPVAEELRRRVGRPDLRVVLLEGGFPAWDRAGLACSSGPCPECKEHR